MRNNEYCFNSSWIKEAHEWCQITVKSCLEKGMDVVVSNTFTQIWEMEPYLRMTREMGIKYEVVCMRSNYGSNLHNVPKEVINRMEERWESFPGEVIFD